MLVSGTYCGDNFVMRSWMTKEEVRKIASVIEQLGCDCRCCHGTGLLVSYGKYPCPECDGTGRERRPL